MKKHSTPLERIDHPLFDSRIARGLPAGRLAAVHGGTSCGKLTGDIFRGRDQIQDA